MDYRLRKSSKFKFTYLGRISKFIARYWKSYWVSAGFFALIGRSSNTLFGFFNFLILVRLLTPDEFGAWALFVSVGVFLELWKAGFIANPLIKYASGEEKEVYKSITTASFQINLLITALQIGVLLGIAPFLESLWEIPGLSGLFYIYLICMFFQVFRSHFTWVQQANFDFKGGFWSNLGYQVCMFSYLFYALLFQLNVSLESLAYVQVIGTIVSTVFAVYLGRKYYTLSWSFEWHRVKQLMNFGKYTFGTNLSSTVMRNVDSWMLGSIVSSAAVGMYNPALRLSNLFELPTSTLTSIAFPKLVTRIKEEGNKSARHLYEKSTALILALMLPFVILVIIFADYVIMLIAGEAYLESVDVLRITMLYGLFIPFNRQVGITLDALGRPKDTFLFVLRNTIMNVIFNYIFITYYGLIGAAIATLLTFVLVFIYNQYFINKLIGVELKRIFNYSIGFYRMGFLQMRKVFNG